jgi:hypothetical protein
MSEVLSFSARAFDVCRGFEATVSATGSSSSRSVRRVVSEVVNRLIRTAR